MRKTYCFHAFSGLNPIPAETLHPYAIDVV
jgi:hypothetical protein